MSLETPLNDLLETGAHVRVLRAVVGLPHDFPASARDIARRASVAHTTAGRILRALAAQHVVHVQRVARSDLYQLNDQHVLASQIRALFRAEARIRPDMIDFLRTELPKRVGPVDDAYLFGSVSRGTSAQAESDIDIALVAPKRSEAELEPVVAHLADRVRERFGHELNVIVATSRRASRGRPRLWDRIEEEGISLLRERRKRG